MARASKTMLNNSGESGHPCLGPDLTENAFRFSPLRIMIDVCLSFMGFVMLSEIGSFYAFFRRRQWHPTPVLLPGKSHGQRSLVGCSPWGR